MGEYNFLIQRKKLDGTMDIYYPATRADNGTTFNDHIKGIHQGEPHGLRLTTKGLIEYYDGINWRVLPIFGEVLTDPTAAPGPKAVFGRGNMQAGFFGEIPMSDFITGDALASALGITAGKSQFSDTAGWLKFAYSGKIQFAAKKPLRYDICWDDIEDINAIYGNRTLVIKGLTCKIRLFRGANKDPADDNSTTTAHGSEWNKLMYPIHRDARNDTWHNPGAVESNTPYWGVDYTNEDLGMVPGTNGSINFCQELTQRMDEFEFGFYGIGRGGNGPSYVATPHQKKDVNDRGWRPVVEVVG